MVLIFAKNNEYHTKYISQGLSSYEPNTNRHVHIFVLHIKIHVLHVFPICCEKWIHVQNVYMEQYIAQHMGCAPLCPIMSEHMFLGMSQKLFIARVYALAELKLHQ